jgi:hypothetical protein
MVEATPVPVPGSRGARVATYSPAPSRTGSDLILDMLARGIPLTLLPDLAWPGAIGHDAATADDAAPERDACSGPPGRPARHGRPGAHSLTQDPLQLALAFAACPTGRHRRTGNGCSRPPAP